MSDVYILREFFGSKLLREFQFRATSDNSAKMKARKNLHSMDTECFIYTGGIAILRKSPGKDSRFKRK